MDPCGQDIARAVQPRLLKLSMDTSYGKRSKVKVTESLLKEYSKVFLSHPMSECDSSDHPVSVIVVVKFFEFFDFFSRSVAWICKV